MEEEKGLCALCTLPRCISYVNIPLQVDVSPEDVPIGRDYNYIPSADDETAVQTLNNSGKITWLVKQGCQDINPGRVQSHRQLCLPLPCVLLLKSLKLLISTSICHNRHVKAVWKR